MIKTQTRVSDIFDDPAFDGGDEMSVEQDQMPMRKTLRGHKPTLRDQARLTMLADDEIEDLINSQLVHRVNKVRTKSGFTPAQTKDPSSADAYLQLKRSATNNYLRESYKFQPTILEKPV